MAVLTAAAIACAASACATDPPDSERSEAYCIRFPNRDAAVYVRAADDPMLRGGNPETVKVLVRSQANTLVNDAPRAVEAPAGVLAQALRGYEPGQDLMARPEVAKAVHDINAWLQANCPSPTPTR